MVTGETLEEDIRAAWYELLRFPSIGADPLHLRDCVNCAMWLKKKLEGMGFAGELFTQGGNPPFLLAERPGDEGQCTILVYGHYDVQPPEPLEEWRTPPFEPTLQGQRVYARGAQDDKGQTFAFLTGVRDFLAQAHPGAVPAIKVLLEGQEESGSTVLSQLAPTLRRRLAADVLMVCDTSAAKDLQPAIIAGMRGVSHFTLRLEGANRDLHSGEYGGVAPNAAQALCELVASLHDAHGAIAVPGFADGLEPPLPEEARIAQQSGATDAELEADIGVSPVGGEEGLSVAERLSFQPTIEVNGIAGGYSGPGSKTIIPRMAFAKISMRLAPGMSPTRACQAVTRYLEGRVPRGMRLSLEAFNVGTAGFRLPLNSPVFHLASQVLAQLDSRGAVFRWEGASIPIVSTLHEISGAAPLLVGFGQSEDRIHSPNESFGVRQFLLCRRWAQKMLEALTA